MSVVIDASALVEVLLRKPASGPVEAALVPGPAFAPELLDAEVLSVLARSERAGALSTKGARSAVRALRDAPVTRVSHRGLIDGAWQRRGNLSTYDALYVALAARLGCALVTTDSRIAAAPGLDVTVTLVRG